MTTNRSEILSQIQAIEGQHKEAGTDHRKDPEWRRLKVAIGPRFTADEWEVAGQ